MSNWFYSINGQTLGPVPEAHLRTWLAQGQLAAHTPVWREGAPAWLPAGRAGLVAPLPPPPLSPLPPPLPPAGSPATRPVVNPFTRFPVPADAGPFLLIGESFSVPGGNWRGPSRASPRAFYLLKVAPCYNAAQYGGGVIGDLAARRSDTFDDLATCDVADLSGDLRSALDKSNNRKPRDVIVLPRETIRLVAMSKIGAVEVHVGNDAFALATGLFNKGKIRSFLTENGWVLNEAMQPTAPPTYASKSGRGQPV